MLGPFSSEKVYLQLFLPPWTAAGNQLIQLNCTVTRVTTVGNSSYLLPLAETVAVKQSRWTFTLWWMKTKTKEELHFSLIFSYTSTFKRVIRALTKVYIPTLVTFGVNMSRCVKVKSRRSGSERQQIRKHVLSIQKILFHISNTL